MGLRLKFNLAVVPLTIALTALMVWVDYRHELAAVMASHAIHGGVADTAAPTGPVKPDTIPEIVAWNSVRGHFAYGVVLLVALIVGVNAALDRLVLWPLRQMRLRLSLLGHGHWRGAVEPTSEDEMGRFGRSLQSLGPEIGALVGQSLQAERLAVLALLAHYLRRELEPDVQGVAQVAVQLNGSPGTDPREAAHELARRAASMIATIRGLDRAFPGGVTNRAGR
ncbi:MAG: hypothetical protein AMXMBFR57_24810 [Acidimicrobiia bacterium]|jgi:hypothetical protein